MLAEWLAPILVWSGLDIVGFLLLVIIVILVLKGD